MLRYYICRICGNLVEMIEDSGVIPSCCGEDMEELIPGTTDGAKEKHVPIWSEIPERKCISIKVGELPHPMTAGHSIQWITLVTSKGIYRRSLLNCDQAQAEFLLQTDETVKAVYAYCNLHGLWIAVSR